MIRIHFIRLGYLLVLLALGILVVQQLRRKDPPAASALIQQLTGQLEKLIESEQQMEKGLFAMEKQSQQFFRQFETLWDSLNEPAGSWAEKALTVHFDDLRVGSYDLQTNVLHGIQIHGSAQSRILTHAQAIEIFRAFSADGWFLERSEFRHNSYLPEGLHGFKSEVYFVAHLTRAHPEQRAILDGTLTVRSAGHKINHIDATALNLRTKDGPPIFNHFLSVEVQPPPGSYFIDPLLIHDLDGDGTSEVILVAANLVLRRQPDGTYARQSLTAENLRLIFTAVLGDFTRNGTVDLLTVRFEGIYLYEGTHEGLFNEPGRLIWAAHPRINYGQVLSSGDLDGDGDLDLFLGQYKPPYTQGQMPSPYDDANDGYPSFLLENDGSGNFKDVTHAAGLGQKRWRRVYSASLADLDADGDLDLVTVSDFAGIDVWENDGAGHFNELTERWFPEGKGLGMSHLVTDLNSDGFLDFLMIGMNSPAADRLNALRLTRSDQNDLGRRSALTYGNRLFLGGAGGFKQDSGNAFQRTGWSWGAVEMDFDNNGFPDLYIANGHETRMFTRDYEPEFWMHDIYVANSKTNPVTGAYFQEKFQKTKGQGSSYGGYEINRFYINEDGTNFIEAAHLLGIASRADSRNAATIDLDNDGRLDLVFTTFEVWPVVKQMVHVYRNNLAEGGNWIGFKAGPDLGSRNLVLHSTSGKRAGSLAAGIGYRTQQTSMHFGLGTNVVIAVEENSKTLNTPLKLNAWNVLAEPVR